MGNRVFIVGAGFSKSIANAPLANEFVGPMYENATNNGLHTDHHIWNEYKEAFLQLVFHLIKSVEHGLKFLEGDGTKIRNRSGLDLIRTINIEQLCTFLDLNLNNPLVPIGVGVDLRSCSIPFIDGMYTFDLEHALRFIRHNIIERLLPANLTTNLDRLAKFSKYTRPGDIFFTFNYDLLIEQALWMERLWNPIDGYLLGDIDRRLEINDKNIFKSQIPVIKLHGSINWQQKGVFGEATQIYLISPFSNESYFHDLNPTIKFPRDTRYRLLDSQFITPTYIKKYNSKDENSLIRNAVDRISHCNELIVLGYSFPEADTLTSILMAHLSTKIPITIVDINAKQIAIDLCEQYGFDKNKIRPEQTSISSWIDNNFELIAYQRYLEEQQFIDDIINSESHAK